MATRAESVKPTSIKDKQSLIHPADKDEEELETTLGKWLVFRYFSELDDTWDTLKRAFDAGKLKAEALKSSTMYYNPTGSGPGSCTQGVIRIYTQKKKRDFVGNQLIKLVKHDIRYKVTAAKEGDALTPHTSAICTTFHTLHWNSGHPTTKHQAGAIQRYTCPSNDLWQLNVVRAPLFHSHDVYGKWVVLSKDREITTHWHLLKKEVNMGKMGASQIVCPGRAKKEDRPVIEVHTTREEKNEVCRLLDEVLGRLYKVYKLK